MRLVVSVLILWPVVCVCFAPALAQVSLAHQNVNLVSCSNARLIFFRKLAVK
jgi:hypothetical protein